MNYSFPHHICQEGCTQNWETDEPVTICLLFTWTLGKFICDWFFPFSISRAHPNSGWYCDLSRTPPLPIISTVMLHLPLFTRLSFSVFHHLISAEWVLPPHPSMAYFSICMTLQIGTLCAEIQHPWKAKWQWWEGSTVWRKL